MRANSSLLLTAAAVLATAFTAVASAAQKDNGNNSQSKGWETGEQVQQDSRYNNAKEKKDKAKKGKAKKQSVAVPEPPTSILMAIALVVLGLSGLRKRRAR